MERVWKRGAIKPLGGPSLFLCFVLVLKTLWWEMGRGSTLSFKLSLRPLFSQLRQNRHVNLMDYIIGTKSGVSVNSVGHLLHVYVHLHLKWAAFSHANSPERASVTTAFTALHLENIAVTFCVDQSYAHKEGGLELGTVPLVYTSCDRELPATDNMDKVSIPVQAVSADTEEPPQQKWSLTRQK